MKPLQAVKLAMHPPTLAQKACWTLDQGALECPVTQHTLHSMANQAGFIKEQRAAGCLFNPCSPPWQMSQ